MKTILISLVSEQTLPNVLFIRKFSEQADAFCFLNTERYQREGRVNWIRDAAGISDQLTFEATLNPEDPSFNLSILNDIDWGNYNRFIVNLTGGTKMMALSAYAYFSTNHPEHSSIYYLPVFDNSIVEVFPENNSQSLDIHINIRDYLKSYGIRILEESNLFLHEKSVDLSKRIFQEYVINDNSETLKKIQNADRISDLTERKIYKGEWLEICMAEIIREKLKIPKENLLQGVKINKIGMPDTTGNQYDVIFCKQNRLYAGECKFFNSGKFKMSGETGAGRDIFKLGNLRHQLGLHASPFIVTANDISGTRDFLPSCEFYGIRKVADISTLRSEPDLNNFINGLI